jgi:hypothetical protein
VPVNQAREAIAFWLAIVAAHPSSGDLQGGLGNGAGIQGTEVGNTFVQTWIGPGGYVTPSGGGVQDTATGYLLAKEMTGLPPQKVSDVLAGAWSRWLDWHTTDAQLAAALGISMPGVSTFVPPGPPGNLPQAPLCTS